MGLPDRRRSPYLFEALAFYFEDAHDHPGWHHHIGGDGGPKLTIAIDT
jgi:hypothetical protein